MPAKKKRSKRKTGATRNSEQNFSTLSMLVIGVLVSAFVGFLVYLDKIPTDAKKSASTDVQASSKKSKQQKPPKHEFDFYTVLPDREVEIIEVEQRKPVKKVSPVQQKPPSITQKNPEKKPIAQARPLQSTSLYQLQVGAFKELSKADAMKARLAFLGVESNIQVIQNNGQKLYRVRVGPSTDNKKMQRIKSQLKAKNINTFMQKLSG